MVGKNLWHGECGEKNKRMLDLDWSVLAPILAKQGSVRALYQHLTYRSYSITPRAQVCEVEPLRHAFVHLSSMSSTYINASMLSFPISIMSQSENIMHTFFTHKPIA